MAIPTLGKSWSTTQVTNSETRLAMKSDCSKRQGGAVIPVTEP
jgi:hypothetical protein